MGLVLSPLLHVPAATGAVPPRDEWRQVNADAAQSRWLPATLKPPLSLAWRRPLGHEWGAVAVATGNRVFVRSLRPDRLDAFRTEDGTLAWSVPLPNKPGTYFDGVPRAVALENKVVFHSTALTRLDLSAAEMVALRAADGSPVWSTSLVSGVSSVSVLKDGSVVATTAFTAAPAVARLVQFDGQTGRRLATHPLGIDHWNNFSPPGEPHLTQQPNSVRLYTEMTGQVPSGGALFVQGAVYLYDFNWLGDGVGTMLSVSGPGLTFSLQTPFPPQKYVQDWVAGVGAAGSTLYWAYPPIVEAMDAKCRRLWRTMLPHPDWPSHFSVPGHPASDVRLASPVITPRRIVVFGWHRIYGLERSTGRLAWQTGDPPGYGMDPTGSTQRTAHKNFEVTEGFQEGVAPVGAGMGLYTIEASRPGGLMDTIVAYSVQTGRKLWSMTMEGWKLGPRMIVHRGALYLTGGDTRAGQNYLLKLVPTPRHSSQARRH